MSKIKRNPVRTKPFKGNSVFLNDPPSILITEINSNKNIVKSRLAVFTNANLGEHDIKQELS